MLKKHFSTKVDRHLKFIESAFFKHIVLHDIKMRDSPQESLQTMRYRQSIKEVELINLDNW